MSNGKKKQMNYQVYPSCEREMFFKHITLVNYFHVVLLPKIKLYCLSYDHIQKVWCVWRIFLVMASAKNLIKISC